MGPNRILVTSLNNINQNYDKFTLMTNHINSLALMIYKDIITKLIIFIMQDIILCFYKVVFFY